MPPRLTPKKQLFCVLSLISVLVCILFAEILQVSVPTFIAFLVLALIAKVVK